MKNFVNLLGAALLLLCFGQIAASKKHKAFNLQPEQVHLSYGENESERVVTWTTLTPSPTPKVEYGKFDMNLTETGTSRTFVDGGKSSRTIYIHKVSLKNLQPNTLYFYHCGSDQGWSDLFRFKTTPFGTTWSPKLAIYGDMGNENAVSLPFLQEISQKMEIDAVIHVGDFAYDMDSKQGTVGDAFMKQIEPIAAYVPYMVCPGNHEKA